MGETKQETWYVAVRSGNKFGWLAGPVPTRADADALVPQIQKLAEEADPWAVFYDFATVHVTKGEYVGKFNEQLGIKAMQPA